MDRDTATHTRVESLGRGDRFERFANVVAVWAGRSRAFVTAAAVVVVWAISGPLFGFSNAWQLVINTSTTILTFLMVFVIQNSLNRDSMAVHLKLDELLRVTTEAQDRLIGAEKLSEGEIEGLEESIADAVKAAHTAGEGPR